MVGRLSENPEFHVNELASMSKFKIAVEKRFKKEGEPDADIINCTAYRRIAEHVERYIKKGMLVTVSGHLSVRDSTMSIMDVIVDEVSKLM